MDLECLILAGEAAFGGKYLSNIDFSPHIISVEKNQFCFSPDSFRSTNVTAEEFTSLRCFLTRSCIKVLSLKHCRFTDAIFTSLCDLIRVNNSLSSVEFSSIQKYEKIRYFFSDEEFSEHDDPVCYSQLSCDDFSMLFSAIHNNHIRFNNVLTLFTLVSSKKITPNVLVNPHYIDGFRGIIRYQDRLKNSDLIALLKALKSGVSIKRVDCRGWRSPSLNGLLALFEVCSINQAVIDLPIAPHFFDVENGILVFSPQQFSKVSTEYLIPTQYVMSVEDITSLQYFLKCFCITEFSVKGCSFTDERIADFSHLFRGNVSLTAFNFIDCSVSDDEHLPNLINALQPIPCLKEINFTISIINLNGLLVVFNQFSAHN
ncbi:hypothetical protein GEMRC1_008358 [Eukaryota sp. GEM-RC1]